MKTYTDTSLGTAPMGRSLIAKWTKLGTRKDHELFTRDIMGHGLLEKLELLIVKHAEVLWNAVEPARCVPMEWSRCSRHSIMQ